MAQFLNGDIFEKHDPIRYGDRQRRENLFIENLLVHKALTNLNRGSEFDEAHSIICRWADLDIGGKLTLDQAQERVPAAIRGEDDSDVRSSRRERGD